MAQRVDRGIALLFHDRGTRRGWVVSSTPRPQFIPGIDPVLIVQEVGWAPGPAWTGGKSRPHWDSIPDRLVVLVAVVKLLLFFVLLQHATYSASSSCTVTTILVSYMPSASLSLPVLSDCHCNTTYGIMHSAICAVLPISNRSAGLNSLGVLWVIDKCAWRHGLEE